ncbi:multidrug ABC transporter permease/ATP-binding protein [Ectopseudomonas chengduensis]|nr:multidrug ABC transporter permease/ATP-binding protein [Pseudomonas chengduensis]WKC37266.1 multidrug ABC transporter permease/ATP-binding protein [Pseudomonas chengduensis]
MKLLRLVFHEYRWSIALVLGLSLTSALLSVAVIAFINQRMLTPASNPGAALGQFVALLALLLVLASAAQLSLTALGHRFVYRMRRALVKRVLDTSIERLEIIGGSNIIASLSSDIRNITLAFVHLPELIYGSVLTLAAFAYLAWLSPGLFFTTLLWMSFTLGVGWLLVGRLNHHLRMLRESEDRLYGDYQAVIDGRKELTLNRDRAQRLYEDEFDLSARAYRDHVTLADRYHGLASNWANIMVLGTIGLVFYLASGLGWASTAVASTYALTILFMRTPLVSAVAAIPAQIAGRVALDKVESLALAPHVEAFEHPADPLSGQWQVLELHEVEYRYPAQDGEPGFDVGPVSLRMERGETVFLVGGNGSGKSTLARLLTGLYLPQRGEIRVDGRVLGPQEWPAYRQLFASVFTDYHLFSQLLGPHGVAASDEELEHWLGSLHMGHKVQVAAGRLRDTRLSAGQRKRLALLLALLEARDILLLDEWAADQDPLFRQVFYRELLPQLKAAGKTVFAISHDDHYFDQADRLLKMDGGQLHELQGEHRARASRNALLEIGGAAHS